VRYNGFTTATL